MLWPTGLNHSKRKMERAATWMATRETNIQLLVSNGSEEDLDQNFLQFYNF